MQVSKVKLTTFSISPPSSRPFYNRPMSKLHGTYQLGQALVEFAIVLILIIIVVAGGAELAISAYHASKTGDGAKAAANDWANAVSFPLEITRQDLLIDTNPEIDTSCDNRPETTCDGSVGIRPALDASCNFSDPSNLFDETLPIDISLCPTTLPGYATGISNLLTYLYPISTPTAADFGVVCTSSNSFFDGIERITACDGSSSQKVLLVSNSLLNNVASYPPRLNTPNGIRVDLGDHSNPSIFNKANCDGVDYDNGLPDQTNIYLFNPLPIDITNCDGSAGNKVDELIAGVGTYEGMPKLNQALRSQYHQVCVAETGGVITIQPLKNCVANGFNLWLKPPGKMCGAGTTTGTEYCPTEGDLNGATGFYFFGDSNISGNNLEYVPTSWASPEFRPTFQLVCGVADYRDGGFDAANECSTLTGAFSVQINTRYRSIFESFLAFGLQAIPTSNLDLLPYFYNPNKVGESNQLVGTAGSEIGPIGGDDKTPTVKRFRDFRGCYQVGIIPPDNIGEQVKTTVSACN